MSELRTIGGVTVSATEPVLFGTPTKFDPFEARLEFLRDQNRRKSAGYAGTDSEDPWANFRESAKFGVPAHVGVAVRMSDKWTRLVNLMRDMGNEQVGESIHDTVLDIAAYALILDVLLSELESHEIDPTSMVFDSSLSQTSSLAVQP